MGYQQVDKMPVMAIETLMETPTLDKWHKEGLPENISPDDFLGMDTFINVPLNFGPIPGFQHKVFYEDKDVIVETESMGATVKRNKEAPGMYYGHIDHPVKTRTDWEKYKQHFLSSSQGRYPENLKEEIERMNNSGNPVCLYLYPFFFRLGFYSMGMERFMTSFFDTPDLMHEIFSYWSGFVLDVIKPVIGKMKIDFAAFVEDLAYKNGPHLSPKIYKEFWLPYQKPIIEELQKNGINIITLWSSGKLDGLLPMLLENGINCIMPCDCDDPVEMRRKYGRKLLMVGGFSKKALIDGPKAIDKETERLMPAVKEGGYILTLDDVVPPETPFNHYRYFINTLKTIKMRD